MVLAANEKKLVKKCKPFGGYKGSILKFSTKYPDNKNVRNETVFHKPPPQV